jgi:hypothetical protein
MISDKSIRGLDATNGSQNFFERSN